MMNRQNKSSRTVTYGVYGLTEWQALFKVGNSTIRIPFKGGSLSGYGCTPAMFTTRSEALMRIIEGSRYFLEKKIRVVSSREDRK